MYIFLFWSWRFKRFSLHLTGKKGSAVNCGSSAEARLSAAFSFLDMYLFSHQFTSNARAFRHFSHTACILFALDADLASPWSGANTQQFKCSEKKAGPLQLSGTVLHSRMRTMWIAGRQIRGNRCGEWLLSVLWWVEKSCSGTGTVHVVEPW